MSKRTVYMLKLGQNVSSKHVLVLPQIYGFVSLHRDI